MFTDIVACKSWLKGLITMKEALINSPEAMNNLEFTASLITPLRSQSGHQERQGFIYEESLVSSQHWDKGNLCSKFSIVFVFLLNLFYFLTFIVTHRSTCKSMKQTISFIVFKNQYLHFFSFINLIKKLVEKQYNIILCVRKVSAMHLSDSLQKARFHPK